MKNVVFFWFSAILVLSGCEENFLGEKFYTITIENNSSETIYFLKYDEFSEIQYPDTSLVNEDPDLIALGASRKFYVRDRNPWNESINELEADTLSVFIFDAQVYEDSIWSVISNQYMILKRYDLSIEDLERLNFVVPYPPNAKMEGMQIYPH